MCIDSIVQQVHFYLGFSSKSKILRLAEHVARMGASGGEYTVLMGKLEGRKPIGRPRRRWG
jgi:hypothetical protein